MYNRVINFAAGPSTLPLEVLEEIREDLMNYKGTGMSVMEMSHRSKTYLSIFDDTKKTLRRVMSIPDDYEILFIQGGATEQFSAIPLNLLAGGKGYYLVTGSFANKAYKEALRYGDAICLYDGSAKSYRHIPNENEYVLPKEASYVYLCSNNTIYGTEWQTYPDTKDIPLVADMSSDIMSRPIDISKFGLIYAGAQKNMGIAGLAVVIIRKDLIGKHSSITPTLMQYSVQAKGDSMYNTPPTFSIYVLGLMAKWVEKMSGLEVMQKRNEEKAKLLYDYLDQSGFYEGRADRESRSMMNVSFFTPSKELDDKFVKESIEAGMSNLKGHREAGGLRASIYNAMTIDNVKVLIEFMKKFEKENA